MSMEEQHTKALGGTLWCCMIVVCAYGGRSSCSMAFSRSRSRRGAQCGVFPCLRGNIVVGNFYGIRRRFGVQPWSSFKAFAQSRRTRLFARFPKGNGYYTVFSGNAMLGKSYWSQQLFFLCAACLLASALTGCVPFVHLDSGRICDIRPYLPPDECDDILVLSIYRDLTGNLSGACSFSIGDAQIVKKPYDKVSLTKTGGLGIASIAWGFGMLRERVLLMLCTRSGHIIAIPIPPYFWANDEAISYFYVMEGAPLSADDICVSSANSLSFRCSALASSEAIGKRLHGLYPWKSPADAQMARAFWEGRTQQTVETPPRWKLHSIFGETW